MPGPPRQPASTIQRKRQIRATDHQWDLIRQAAESQGLQRSEFIRRVAVRAAREILDPTLAEADHPELLPF